MNRESGIGDFLTMSSSYNPEMGWSELYKILFVCCYELKKTTIRSATISLNSTNNSKFRGNHLFQLFQTSTVNSSFVGFSVVVFSFRRDIISYSLWKYAIVTNICLEWKILNNF